MTYRVGTDPRHLHRGSDCIGVMFDPADTALVVDVLEGRTDTPDVDHARGAAEALAHVRRQVEAWSEWSSGVKLSQALVLDMLHNAAAELGVDEEAPTRPLSATETAQTGPADLLVTPDAHGSPEAPTEIVHLAGPNEWTTRCCYRPVGDFKPGGDWFTEYPDNVTCGITPGEPERKPDDPPHPTCVDVTTWGRRPRSKSLCGPDCPRCADEREECR